MPEDQDRIHKSFKVDDDNQLITVPFSGWQPTDGEDWCGRSLNGVRLVDFVGDELTLRGATTSLGQARRAFVAGGSLFTVADQEVAAYDISDRDAPEPLSQAPLALNVALTLPTGDKLARLRQDWYTADMRLEVVAKDAAEALVAPVTLNVTDYLREHFDLQACGYWYPYNEPMFVVGDTVWLIINDYGQWTETKGYDKARSLLLGFSPESGEVLGSLEIPFLPGYWGWSNTSRVVRGDVAFLMQEGWDGDAIQRSLAALDLSDPEHPSLASTLALPVDENYWGSTGLLESGDELVTSYAKSIPGKDSVVRHFALRVDVSDPLSPKLLSSHNVPGYLVDFDAGTQVAVTLDHQPLDVKGDSYEDCYEKLPSSWFDQSAGLCHGFTATLHRVSLSGERARVLGSERIDELAWSTPRRGDGRLFFTEGYGGYGVADPAIASDAGYYHGWSWESQNVTVVDATTLGHASIEAPGVWNVMASGKRLILAPSAGQPLSVIDGTDAEHPELVEGDETALGYTNHMSVDGEDVFLSQGDGGVQHLSLP